MNKKIIASIIGGLSILALSACRDDAVIASKNLSKAADNFEIMRRIVFTNTWTGKYELEIIGFCNITAEPRQLETVCKDNEGRHAKHFLGLHGNMTYFVEQVNGVSVSENFYRVTFKPDSLLPNVDLRGNLDESAMSGPKSQ